MMTTDPTAREIYHDRLTEQLNQLADLKFQLAESIDNHGQTELETAYQSVPFAYNAILKGIQSIAH